MSADRWFTPTEISAHNAPYDIWLSWNGNVYDLTPLTLAHKGDPLLTPILKNAGKDISHWFEPNGQLKTCVNPLTGTIIPYTPEGRFVDVPPPLPRSDIKISDNVPCSRTRKIKILNTLNQDEHIVEVCSEEKVSAIQDRYTSFNSHAKGYIWKRLGVLMDMSATLEGNGIKDDAEVMAVLGMDIDKYLPTIHLYFRWRKFYSSDDLTVA